MRSAYFLAAALAFASPGGAASQNTDAVTAVTSKSLDAFAQCFVRTQQRASAAWWFVPNSEGGTFSNLGAEKASGSYFLDVRELGSARGVELRLQSTEPAIETAVRRAINQCA